MTRAAAAVAAAALLLAPGAAHAACADADLEAAPGTIDSVRAAILCVINEHRAVAGLDRLRASPQLDESAAWHSADMVAFGFLAHAAPGRPSLFRRVSGSGYFARTTDGLYSENIGIAPLGGASATRVVDAWLQSPEHRANVLYPRFSDLGVGAAFTPPHPVFYPGHSAVVLTTDFGRRLPAVERRPRCRKRKAPPAGSATKPQRWCRKR